MAKTTKALTRGASALILTGILFSTVCIAAHADVVVIGNKAGPVSSMTEKQVNDIYLGKVANLPDGSPVEFVDLPAENSVRDEFYDKVIGKDASQIKAYWAKRVFTGKGTPPETKGSEAAVVQWVSGGVGRIGYVSPGAADGSVKVLLRKP
jgi:ABC-type phosphate transport system substrate-binding protein